MSKDLAIEFSSPERPSTYHVLVCGSNYGRAYLAALAQSGGRFLPAGLLAHGSRRSRSVAARYGLPLFRRVDELPEGIDLACVALPSSATGNVVFALLDRGIHVLCEHPQRSGWIDDAFTVAAKTSVRFQVNGHFSDLPAPAAFAERCRRLSLDSPPRFLDVVAHERSLYAAIDVVRRGLGSLSQLHVRPTVTGGDFVTIEGHLGSTRTLFHVQVPPGRLRDGSFDYLFDLRITAAFERGVVTLASLAGPVLWNANYSRAGGGSEPLWSTVYGESPTTGNQLQRSRTTANLTALERLVREVETGNVAPEAGHGHALDVAHTWERLGNALREDDP